MSKIGDDDQSYVMRQIGNDPKMNKAMCKAGYIKSDESTMAIAEASQREKLLGIALKMGKVQGRAPDDKRAWAESSLSLAVMTPPALKRNEESPSNQPAKKRLSFRKQAKVHGLSHLTGWRYLLRALKKRRLMEVNAEDILWSSLPPRLKAQKVPDTVRSQLQEWIMHHPCLIVSLIKSDTLLVKDKDGNKVKMPKLLLECTPRELHNDMLKPVLKGGFRGAYDDKGNALISDTALRSFLPKNLRKMTNRYKQMCCCETCVVPKGLLKSLHSWQTKRIVFLRNNSLNYKATKYSGEILVDGQV